MTPAMWLVGSTTFDPYERADDDRYLWVCWSEASARALVAAMPAAAADGAWLARVDVFEGGDPGGAWAELRAKDAEASARLKKECDEGLARTKALIASWGSK